MDALSQAASGQIEPVVRVANIVVPRDHRLEHFQVGDARFRAKLPAILALRQEDDEVLQQFQPVRGEAAVGIQLENLLEHFQGLLVSVLAQQRRGAVGQGPDPLLFLLGQSGQSGPFRLGLLAPDLFNSILLPQPASTFDLRQLGPGLGQQRAVLFIGEEALSGLKNVLGEAHLIGREVEVSFVFGFEGGKVQRILGPCHGLSELNFRLLPADASDPHRPGVRFG